MDKHTYTQAQAKHDLLPEGRWALKNIELLQKYAMEIYYADFAYVTAKYSITV